MLLWCQALDYPATSFLTEGVVSVSFGEDSYILVMDDGCTLEVPAGRFRLFREVTSSFSADSK